MLPTVAAEDRDLMLRHPKEGKQQPKRKDVEATPTQAGYAASSLAYTDEFATRWLQRLALAGGSRAAPAAPSAACLSRLEDTAPNQLLEKLPLPRRRANRDTSVRRCKL